MANFAYLCLASGGYAAGTWWPIAPNLASLGDFGPVWDTSAVAISSPALSATSQLSLQAQAELSLRDIWWQAGEPGYRVPISQSLVSEAMAKSSLLLFVSYADFAATLVVAGVALWLFFRARKMEQSLDDKNWTISDYTVKVRPRQHPRCRYASPLPLAWALVSVQVRFRGHS